MATKDLLRRITPRPLWRSAAAVKRRIRLEIGRRSYSAHAEDLLIASWLRREIDFHSIRYVDVGAAHPLELSNTYLFYKHGARGVLVEPDPRHTRLLRRRRSRDILVNAGIAFDDRRRGRLFRLTFPVFNTFSEEQATRCVEVSKSWEPHERQAIIDTIEVPLIPINDVIINSLHNERPHLISVDTEGVDLAILRTLDLDLMAKRAIICVERTLASLEFDKILRPGGFSLFAETPDNWLYLRS